MYKKYALELVDKGYAYFCFCPKDDIENNDTSKDGYNLHCRCRDVSKEEVESHLSAGKSFVIRQKMPLEGVTSFNDFVFGEISVENKTLDAVSYTHLDVYKRQAHRRIELLFQE